MDTFLYLIRILPEGNNIKIYIIIHYRNWLCVQIQQMNEVQPCCLLSHKSMDWSVLWNMALISKRLLVAFCDVKLVKWHQTRYQLNLQLESVFATSVFTPLFYNLSHLSVPVMYTFVKALKIVGPIMPLSSPHFQPKKVPISL